MTKKELQEKLNEFPDELEVNSTSSQSRLSNEKLRKFRLIFGVLTLNDLMVVLFNLSRGYVSTFSSMALVVVLTLVASLFGYCLGKVR